MSNKIIVVQVGSRHRYLIPKVLNKHGLLCRLYTDSTCYSKIGRFAQLISKLGFKGNQLLRLLRRNPNLSKKIVYSTDILFYQKIWLTIKQASLFERLKLIYSGIEHQCIKWGVADADCVYGMYFEGYEFLKYAKSKGLKVVVDIYETPMTYKYLIDEIKNNSEYQVFKDTLPIYENKHAVRMHYIEDLLKLADYYTVPSSFVEKSLHVFKNFSPEKVLLLPYASSIVPDVYDYHPIKHRIIFVGSDAVRKGLIYCAKAATILKKIYVDLDFQVIGMGFEKIKNIQVFNDLNFVGSYNKTQLIEAYRSAEVYLFPTLFEGFAGTIIEAASCGCPIITTENSGADKSEFPAIFVKEKNVIELVTAVRQIFDNPEYRNKLSRAVYDYSKVLKPEVYEKKLIGYLNNL